MTLTLLRDLQGWGVTPITGEIVEAADGTARVYGRIFPEPMTRADWTTHDYNVHFVVGLSNAASGPRSVEVLIETGDFASLPDRRPVLYVSEAPDAGWSRAELPSRTDGKRAYALHVDVPANGRIWISNTLPRDLAALTTRGDELARAGGAERVIYGRSLDGRELVAYRYRQNPRNPVLLVTSGFHPPEPDTFATHAIMAWLSGSDGKKLIERLSVVVVPVANPDGYARMTQAANAAGINFYWHFACDRPDICPEASWLWAFACGLMPAGYIDFHAYTFQANKSRGPYTRPISLYRAAPARKAAEQVYDRVLTLPETKSVTGFPTYAPQTLGTMLARRFDTVTMAKYHLHLDDGPEECGNHGADVFRMMAEVIMRHRLQPEIRGYGWQGALQDMRVMWAGLLRPSFGALRRGRWRQIQLRRYGLELQPEGRRLE